MKKTQNPIHRLVYEVNKVLLDNKDGSSQEDQVRLLMALEESFKSLVWKYKVQCREIYKKFILQVVVENKNILSARPFFRERSGVFNSEITPAIRSGDVFKLKKFRINYPFIKYIKDNWVGPFPQECQKVYDDLAESRRKLIENNIPLAINKAKIFHRKVSQTHLNLNDLIGIASLGLINGIDKWVGDYDPKIRGMWIGRMTGNLIKDCSQTLIYFYPSDRQVLYKARSVWNHYKVEDTAVLAKILNHAASEDATGEMLEVDSEESLGVKLKTKVTPEELDRLFGAASVLSSETETEGSGFNQSVFKNSIVDIYNIQDRNEEEDYVNKDLLSTVLSKARELSVMHKKVIKMKGVKL